MKKNSVFKKILSFIKQVDTINRAKATDMLEFELRELENIFCLLLFGSFTGMPSPPAQITIQLLPLMQNEFKTMFTRIGLAHDALAEIVSVLGEP
ncbi:MAG: hypothetical protein JXB88_02985 [Spirochaetales bacterium]|nr:hypothetical protein [Spirochaetales bacterium]